MKTFTLTEGDHKAMDILIPRYPLHIAERIISFLEFQGNYERGDLQMWAELNSYPYLKRRIAKRISIVVNVPAFRRLSREYTIEQNLKDETMELLSRCTDSFFLLFRIESLGPGILENSGMCESEKRQLALDISLGKRYCIIDVFNFLRQTPRRYKRCWELLHSFEFMRLMRQRQHKPDIMYVIKKWPEKKYALKALFFPTQFVPRGQCIIPDPLKPLGYNFAPPFTNPQSSELGDFADKLYIRQGYHCKKSFWKRLRKVLKITMDRKYQERCFESKCY